MCTKNARTLDGVKATIKVKERAKPIHIRPCMAPFALKERVGLEFDRLESVGIMKNICYSEWDTSIVPILKSEGSIQICGEY